MNRHAKSSGCKAKKGQRSIYNFYKPATQPENAESSEEEFDSDVYDNMDEDDLLQVDEIDNDDNNISIPPLITKNNKKQIHQLKKRQVCCGLQSEQISLYIKHTPAQFGGSRRIETIAHELFPRLVSKKFSRKKLNYEEKRKLNWTLYAESTWQVDRTSEYF